MKLLYLLIVLFLGAASAASIGHAQAPLPNAPSSGAAPSVNPLPSRGAADIPASDVGKDRAAPSIENSLVETWMNMSSQFNDRLLGTVYWTLGVLGGVFLALIGYSWFVNYRIYERDKAALMEALRADLQLELERARANFSRAQDALNTQLGEQFTKLEGAIDERLKKRVDPIEGGLKNLRGVVSSNHKYAKMQFAALSSKENEQNGIISNAVMDEAIRGSLALEIGEWVEAEEALDHIEQLLKKDPLRGGWETYVTDFLKALPENYHTRKETIIRRITSLD